MLQAVGQKTGQTDDEEVSEALTSERRSMGIRLVRAVFQIALMAAVLIGAYIGMNRLIAAKPERTARPQFEVVLPVEAATINLAGQRPVVRLFGEITAARSLDIRASVSGEVVSVNPGLSAGTEVKAGDELFSIDRFDFEVALAEAQANLAQTDAAIAENRARLAAERTQLTFAESQVNLAKADLERASQLRRNGTLTQKQVDDRLFVVSQREQAANQRRNNIAIEEARLAQQDAIRQRLALGVQRARRNLENTVVRAPFAGIIRTSTVEMGRVVATSDVAVSMYDASALDVRFTLTDAQYGRIAVDGDPLIGRNVDLIWTVGGTDYEYAGRVSRIGADIASERGGVDVYARLDDGEDAPVQLRPGAFVEVAVPDRLYPNAARVPETAIFDGNIVYVIKEGLLEAREIDLAAFDGAEAIVSSGLQNGEQVLATRISEIEEGLKVRIADPDGNGPADDPVRTNGASGGGRPSPEIIAAAKKLSGLSDTQWDELPRAERRPFIDRARSAAQGN